MFQIKELMNRVTILLVFLTFCFSNCVSGQIFGGTPSSVKWKVVHSIPANIIYPPGLDSEAREVAFLVSALSKSTLSTIGTQQRPIDIVFHNLTTIPNGYVQLAPFRSEFQLTPSQNSFDLGSLPWHETLAIHEYRHVQQYNNFRVGLSKAFYILFGQDGLALANSLSVPDWLFEGDAVFQETLVSQQGRGRLPLFLAGFDALWVSRKNYSWMKLRNGSYRDYTPNWYPLGYMMIAYGREHYGADFWNKVAGEAAAFKGLFFPLQKAIKRNAGVSFEKFHDSALAFFQKQLPEQAYASPEAEYGKKMHHFVADELFPQFIDSSHNVFLNISYRRPPEFVTQLKGEDKLTRLKFQSVAIDETFTYRNHKIAYTAFEPDLRWGWRDYSVIRILDINTKKDIRLAGKTKYFSPDISPDGNSIVAVNMANTGKSSLDILDMHSGKIIWQIPNPDQLVYTYPKFFSPNQVISAVRNKRGEMGLMQIEIPSGIQHLLIDWSMEPIGFVSVERDKIYFTRTYHEQDQGFYLKDGQIFSLKRNASTGNYQLSGGYEKITWSSLTSAGYRMEVSDEKDAFDKQPVVFPPIDTSEKHLVFALDHPPFQIPFPIPDSNFEVNSYNKFTHPFNFYSWRPYVNDPNYTLALLGQNVLNTFQSEIFVGYNRNEESKNAGMDFTYGGLFPYINVGAEYIIDRNSYYGNQKIYWNELLSYAGLSVPLNLSRGRWLTSLEGGSNITFHQEYYNGTFKDSIKNTTYFSLDPQILFTHQLQTARLQIYPSFAQTLLLQYNQAITNISGNQLLASANFYFPGFSSTNSIVLNTSFQQRDSLNQVRFSNNFPFARGYTGVNFYQMYTVGINYNLPLVYPDWGFANMVYIFRIRANAYYDYTGVPFYYTNGPGVQSQYRSTGIEIYLDTQWWNQLPLSFGIRYSRLLDADYAGRGPNQWELILPLNILNKGYSSRFTNL